jgi:hypothetical protein
VLVYKPGYHPEVYAWVEDLARLGACEVGQGHKGLVCRRRFVAYRMACAVPLTTMWRV